MHDSAPDLRNVVTEVFREGCKGQLGFCHGRGAGRPEPVAGCRPHQEGCSINRHGQHGQPTQVAGMPGQLRRSSNDPAGGWEKKQQNADLTCIVRFRVILIV